MRRQQEGQELKEFTEALPSVRRELHRYLARMTGSVIDGEDLLQDALTSAAVALQSGAEVRDLRAWLFRIAHNTALNFFRTRKRETAMIEQLINLPPTPQSEPGGGLPEALKPYLSLSAYQRSVVILRDVLGYTAPEVAELTGLSVAAVKSALHRGRSELSLARDREEEVSSTLSEREAELLRNYSERFNAHDFDRVRDMLSAEVQLELVSVESRKGKESVSGYFQNYANQTDWHFAPGLLEGRPAVLASNRGDVTAKPVYFVLIEFGELGVESIRDFRYARYAMVDAKWSIHK